MNIYTFVIPFQKIIAWFLIGLLSFEVIFRIPFSIPDASALESADHEDIVSLVVEEDLFRQISSDIDTYARRIQDKLPHTRVTILTFAKDASPYLIASANERLYLSGLPDHGEKTQKLVGTILIGHIPIPVVHKDGKSFLSLYPYTDFDEPHFFWNWTTSRYEFLNQKKKDPRADIWHSVIDPNTGDSQNDITKIREFFARVYEYDNKKWQYQNVGVDPQVFYMDSIGESRAASKWLLSVYEQFFLPQQENLLYNRFTREFSQYLYAWFLSLMKTDGNTVVPDFRDWKPDANSDTAFLNQAADITTKVFSDELITPFIKVINEKYLWDVSRWVHNTGRYYNGSSDVRVDTIPELITTKDTLTSQIIKEWNDVLEKLIDSYVDSNLSLDIPILVSRPFQKTIREIDGSGRRAREVSRTYNFVYDNYFYGTQAHQIKSAADCSLIRGSSFAGMNTTVETNHGFNMLGVQGDSEKILSDTNQWIDCPVPTQSYWGWNSPMNSEYRDGNVVLGAHRYDDFTQPILDIAAGKRTTGTNSPNDCLRTDLILRPYEREGLNNKIHIWPVETGGKWYSCATPLQTPTPYPLALDPTPERDENILSSMITCSGSEGDMTLLDRDGTNLGLCHTNGLTGTYKRISSLIKHNDPTTSVFGKQLQWSSTPNLPVDEERYLLYLDRTGTQGRINYPNLFDISVDLSDTDEVIIDKIRASLLSSQGSLTNTVTLPSQHKWSRLVQPSSVNSVNLSDTLLTDSNIRAGIIEALRWRQLDIETKYKYVFETALSPTSTLHNLILPDKKDIYEVSYLGGQGDARNFVFWFAPDKKNDLPEWFSRIETAHQSLQNTLQDSPVTGLAPQYTLSSDEINHLLGRSESPALPWSEQNPTSENNWWSSSSSDPLSLWCEILSRVVVWQWLTNILCWLESIMGTESYTVDSNSEWFPEFAFSDGRAKSKEDVEKSNNNAVLSNGDASLETNSLDKQTAFDVTVIGSVGSSTSQTIMAGDSRGIEILLSGNDRYPAAVDIKVYDYVTSQEQASFWAVPVIDERVRLGSPAVGALIQRAGKYTMILTTADTQQETTFMISPAQPERLDVSLANILLLGTPAPVSLSLKDAWWNTIDPQGWNMEVKSSYRIKLIPFSLEPNTVFSGKALAKTTLTPLESGNTTLDITLTRDSQKISTTLSRPVLSDIRVAVEMPSREVKVGQDVPVNFLIQRQDGTLVDTWDMPLRIAVQGGNATLKTELVTFVWGKATALLKTGTKPAVASFYTRDSGLGKTIGQSFTILSGEPVRIALTSPETLFAQTGARGVLTVRLYDSYNNLTPLQWYTLITVPDKIELLQPITPYREISPGIFESDILSTGESWRILFRAWLEKDNKKSSIPTLEHVSETNVLPVITSEQAWQNQWQNITQIILGAAFGQTPIQGYFGWSALFAPQTKTLALTTLLDTPVKPIITVTPSWNIAAGSLQYGTWIQIDIDSYRDGILTLGVTDSRLGNIARIRYPLLSDISTKPCDDICRQDTMYFTPSALDVYYQDGVVYRNSQRLFWVKEIFSFPDLSFVFVQNNSQALQFSVLQNGTTLGILSLQWKPRTPQELSTASRNDSIIIEPLLHTILTKLSWSNKSSYEAPSMVIYSPSKNEYLGGPHAQWWSSYPEQSGLGWSGGNTSLLQFASWENWSDSMKDHADYLTINLWDPIIHLPNYGVNAVTGFDKTLGKPVYLGHSDVDDFTFRDTNNDGQKDLISYHSDGTIWMALWRSDGSTLDAWDLLSVRNSQKSMIRSGDFTGDGYADIVYVDSKGILHLVSHDSGGPTEKPLQYDKIPLLWKVDQLEVFDMDHDGLDDIVVMDNLGSLSIFYGHTSGVFRNQLIENVYDFSFSDEAKTSYFTGAIRYSGIGFVDPDRMEKTDNYEMQSKQDQVNGLLFTQIAIPEKASLITQPQSLGNRLVQWFSGDNNNLLRMYDGDSKELTDTLKNGYNSFEKNNDALVTDGSTLSQNYTWYNLLKAPFVVPSALRIKKQYTSLEPSGQVLPGSPIEIKITLQNTSSQPIRDIIISENFADYISVSQLEYDFVQNWQTVKKKFISDSQEGSTAIADLRNISVAPNETITIVYLATLRSFSFGKFDVGYLEDSQDPTSTTLIPKTDIRTINPSALEKESIVESEFYNHDNYGDIRFNPNETCGGPVLLWRSHNSYDRTYQKTIIKREIVDADKNALRLSVDPTSSLAGNSATTSTKNSTPDELAAQSQSQLVSWQKDSDGDSIPDKDDKDYGDVFQMIIKNNIPQVLMELGKIDSVASGITSGINQLLSSLGSGFGNAGCISMPINWSPNLPWNTISALWYPTPWANQAPKACFNDVRCGRPIISIPTGPNRRWAGWALDMTKAQSAATSSSGLNDSADAGGSVRGLKAGNYTPGLWISKFRVFLSTTLTGAMTQLTCFGPNNAIANKPGMFPLRFDGNCIYAVQQLLQCLDDGSEDEPLDNENEVSESLPETWNDVNDTWERNRFSDASSCSSFEPIDTYPSGLSQAASNYFNQINDDTISAVLQNIAQHPEIVDGSSSGDSALEFITKYGGDIIKIALNSGIMDFISSGWKTPINLESIRGFPNFIMDWYQRQMDEVISSLTQFPDLNLSLPDLSHLGDLGAIPELESGIQQGGVSSLLQSGGSLWAIIPRTYALPNNRIWSDNSKGPKIFQGSPQQSQKLFPLTVNPRFKRINAEIPYAGALEIQHALEEYTVALEAFKSAPGGSSSHAAAISSLEQNIETLKEYQWLPERLQEVYYEKEKHLHWLSQNVTETQKFMGDWMSSNGPKFNDWSESFILNTKMLDSWQVLIDVFNDYEASCWVNRNERWNLQHWMSIVIPQIIPKIPVIEMPRFPDVTADYSKMDTSIDPEIPDYNITFKPLPLPRAPSVPPAGASASPMPILPKIPSLSADIAEPSVDIPKLPNLPPAPKMPWLSAALKPALGIFNATTKMQCLYRKVPLAPEWVAGTKVAHKAERQGYLPFDFLDRNRGYKEKWQNFMRFLWDTNTVQVVTDRSIGNSKTSLDTIQNSLKSLSQQLVKSGETEDFIVQIPTLISDLVTATQYPSQESPRDWLAQFSKMIQEIDMSPERRKQFAQLLDVNQAPQSTLVVGDMNSQFQQVENAIELDRAENKKIINDLIVWGNGSENPEDIDFLAQRMSGRPHLAQSSTRVNHLSALGTTVLSPVISTLNSSLSTISVTPVPVPTEAVTFESMTKEQGLAKTRWLYVSQGATNHKLIDYSDYSWSTQFHTVDDDGDGDQDLYYSIWNIIYRKENHSKIPTFYTIKDAPKIYTTRDIYQKFFGMSEPTLLWIPRDGQIDIHQNNSPGTVDYQMYLKNGNEHMRLVLFRSLFETNPQKAAYQIDALPQIKNDPNLPISSVPFIADIDGTAFIEHNTIYRTLLTKSRYIDDAWSLQDLSPDFIIRSGQSGYTKERSVVEVMTKGKTVSYEMSAGQRVRFNSDSSVLVRKWSLILFGNATEKRPLSVRDMRLPLLPHDTIITDAGGTVSIAFPDWTETVVWLSQVWSLSEYPPGAGIKKLSFPVKSAWYYGHITDARSLDQKRFPHATVFDAYANFLQWSIFSQIPPQIKLSLPSPTEIDFQSYFPVDTLSNVEIFGLSSSQFRRISPTAIAFETQQESAPIVVRVTVSGRIQEYWVKIVTDAPKLSIKTLQSDGKVAGTSVSVSPLLPLGIQTYIDNQSWTLSRWFSSNADVFSTSVERVNPKISLATGESPLVTYDRNAAFPTLSAGVSLVPMISLGQTFGYSLWLAGVEQLQIRYVLPETVFRQVVTSAEMNKPGVYITGLGLRLETATLRDTLKGGAYIVDTNYIPLVTLDSRGIVRTLDTNITWSVKTENNRVIFTLSRDRVELWQIILNGSFVTTLTQ